MDDVGFEHPLHELATFRELSPPERQALLAHLATCAACRADWEAFQRQDALLGGLPQPLPRFRRWSERPRRRVPDAWSGLSRLGDAVAVGGLAILTLAVVLGVRAIATGALQTGHPPLGPAARPLPSPEFSAGLQPWLQAAPWLGGGLGLVGLLLVLGRRDRRWALLGVGWALVLLLAFVPPFSAVPDPLGIAWRLVGGYSYDPNLPFKNLFLIWGDPTAELRPHLERLVGQVGLDPLDPSQPLAAYRFERVRLARDHDMTLVTTRFIYTGGGSRLYDIPLADPLQGPLGAYTWTWQNDGLARLRTVHLALPGQPFATEASQLRLGEPERLASTLLVDRLDAHNPAHWLWISNRLQHLVWSPRGDAFLLVEERPDRTRQLWLVPWADAPPQPVNHGGSVFEYGWSPDGEFIVYTAPGGLSLSPAARDEMVSLVVVRRAEPRLPAVRRAISNAGLPGLTAQGAWYVQDGAVWLMDYASGESIRVAELSDWGGGVSDPSRPTFWPLAVSPPGTSGRSRLAYACGADLCLADLDGRHRRRLPATGIRSITWDPTGERLAAVSLDENNLGPVRVLIVSNLGQRLQEVEIAPRDATDPPQWTPDGELVLVQTYPMGGRRILAIEVDSGRAVDLSREHWDAYFALSPDGTRLLLNNGRGGFWLVPLVR